MLTVEYSEDEGNTVPYPPMFDEIRQNHGFVDVRGKPELANEIFEGSQSPALKSILIELAHKNSDFFSLGCDLGAHEEDENEKGIRQIAGGYLQVINRNYCDWDAAKYLNLAESLAEKIELGSRGHYWLVRFIHTPVLLNLDSLNSIFSSLWIWFYAGAGTAEHALRSREELIEKIRSTIKQ